MKFAADYCSDTGPAAGLIVQLLAGRQDAPDWLALQDRMAANLSLGCPSLTQGLQASTPILLRTLQSAPGAANGLLQHYPSSMTSNGM